MSQHPVCSLHIYQSIIFFDRETFNGFSYNMIALLLDTEAFNCINKYCMVTRVGIVCSPFSFHWQERFILNQVVSMPDFRPSHTLDSPLSVSIIPYS